MVMMGDIQDDRPPGMYRGTGAGRGGRVYSPGASRPLPLVRGIALLLVAAVLAGILAGGCGSTRGKVNDYLEVAEEVQGKVETGAAEMEKFWTLPLAGQGDIKAKLAEFRAALAEGQAEVDKVDAPEPCRELARLLRQSLDRGRELADMTTPFADYIADIAPIAQQITEVTTTLQQLIDKKDIPSGFSSLYDKVNEINSSFGTVLPPSIFQEIHHELGEFVHSMVEEFNKANKKLGEWRGEEGEDEPTEENGEPEEEPEEEVEEEPKRESPENRAIKGYLKDIPGAWARMGGELAAMFDEMRESTGLKHKEAVVRDLLGKVKAEIEKLKKEYR